MMNDNIEEHARLKQDVLATPEAIDKYCLMLAEGLKERLKIRERMEQIRAQDRKNLTKINDARQVIGDFGLGIVTI